jgi:hypothetical protein
MAVSELSDAFPELKPGSTERDQNTIKTMQHTGVDLNDNTFGWSEFSAEPIEVVFIPGYLEILMLEPHVRTLAERLRACLDRPESINLNEKGDSYAAGRNRRQYTVQGRA